VEEKYGLAQKTLRLLMPQWQRGNNPTYYLDARLLAWLAPESDAQFAEVPVTKPDGMKLPVEDGIVAKSAWPTKVQLAGNGATHLLRALRYFPFNRSSTTC
jgi:hypothetical protein